MSYEDDEIAEGGEMHEINGTEYSVVGDEVYKKDFWGHWGLVEDVDQEAEVGDKREVNGTEYSIVGGTVYRKNWLSGWDEITDEDECAEAGDIEEVGNYTYSHVGEKVYRKSFFGGWDLVTDEQEEAETGEIHYFEGTEYSIAGGTVYKMGLWGKWVEVTDPEICAGLGDEYKYNNSTYSRLGDNLYKKNIWGDWKKLQGDSEDDEEEDEDESSDDEGSTSDDYSSSYSSSGANHSTYTQSSATESSSGSPVLGLIVLVLLIIIGIWIYKAASNSSSPGYGPSAAAYVQPSDQQPEVAQENPYGEGMGQVSFFKTCILCDDIEILLDSNSLGIYTTSSLSDVPNCGGRETFFASVPFGTRIFTLKNQHGEVWQQEVTVMEGECVLVKIEKPAVSEQPPETDQRENPANQVIDEEFQVISPKDRAVFTYPRYTDVEWGPHAKAEIYEVEFQVSDTPYDYTATSFGPPPNGGLYPTYNRYFRVQGMGQQVHRLRIRALAGSEIIAVTPWRYFTYDR